MVGSNGTMIAIRLVRSKLRKREEHHHHHHHHNGSAVHPEVQVQQCTPAPTQQQQSQGVVNPAMSASTTTVDSCCGGGQSATSTIVAVLGNGCNGQDAKSPDAGGATLFATNASGNPDQLIWQFPPPYPPPNTPPPQYTLYNDQDTLVHGLQQDRQGFAKGFRKNLGGRWRRLVKRKPETETCAIPPELKDQLKTIYVY